MSVKPDPGDIRPDQTQESYPFGERCHNRRGHEAHAWQLVTTDGTIDLNCEGHTFCGRSGHVDSEGCRFEAICTSAAGHDGECLDDIWGNFIPFN